MEGTRAELEADRDSLSLKLGLIEADIGAIKAEMAARLGGVEAEAQRIRTRLGQINSELQRREAADALVPTISDHALLRYIERACGIDVEAMKAELLTDAVVLAIKSGASAVKSPAGVMVIRGSTVVTFKEEPSRNNRKGRHGHRPERERDWKQDAYEL